MKVSREIKPMSRDFSELLLLAYKDSDSTDKKLIPCPMSTLLMKVIE